MTKDTESILILLKKNIDDMNQSQIYTQIMGNLGLLKGKKATCYPGFDKYLEGAEYTGAMVEKDGNFITGKGPGAAIEFGLALVEHLCGKEKVKELKSAMCLTK